MTEVARAACTHKITTMCQASQMQHHPIVFLLASNKNCKVFLLSSSRIEGAMPSNYDIRESGSGCPVPPLPVPPSLLFLGKVAYIMKVETSWLTLLNIEHSLRRDSL